MAWPLLGQWDRETTPPGASVADLPVICAALCKAINQRRKYSRYFEGAAIGSEASFTYAQGSSKTYPTAEDFSPTTGVRNAINGSIVRGLLLQMKDAIEGIVDEDSPLTNQRFYTDSNYTTRWTKSALWSAASAGLDAWNIAAPVTKADNWLILKNALNLLRYIKVAAPREVTSAPEYTATDEDLESVYPPIVDGEYSPPYVNVEDIINCASELLVSPGTPGVTVFAHERFPGHPGGATVCLTQTVSYTAPAYIGTALHSTYSADVPAATATSNFTFGGGSLSPTRSVSFIPSISPSGVTTLTVTFDPGASGIFLLEGDTPGNDLDEHTELVAGVPGPWNISSSLTGEVPSQVLNLYIDLASALEDQS